MPFLPPNQQRQSNEGQVTVTVKANAHRHARHDTDRTVLSCLVWRLDRQGAFCVWSVSGGAVRPPDALRRRTHLSGGQFTPPHQTRQDSRACLSTAAAATQFRQTATPSRPTAHTQRRCTPRKRKQAVDCCIWLNSTKRHATRVIYRLSVLCETVSRLSSHRLTGQRQVYLVVWWAVWIGHYTATSRPPWTTLLRVQIPAKAKFAPICVRNSLLSELSWELLLIFYASSDLLVCLHWKLVCLHWKKSPVYGVFGQ